MSDISDLLSGTIEFNWPGKQCEISFINGNWELKPNNNQTIKRALLFDSRIGESQNILGYCIKGDTITSLNSLHSFLSNSIKFIYFDAPRLTVFQGISKSGYSTATWLSLIRQTAIKSIKCLSRKGFFALHTDEEMSHYGRIVLEEIFGKNNYVGTFAWQKQYAPQNDNTVPTDVIDYITVFSKSPIEELTKIGLLVTPNKLKDDGDFRGCYTEGHKGARSGSEVSKFKINTSPYHWAILDSNLPKGRYYFDKILGSLWFESVESTGDFFVTIQATDKNGNIAEKRIDFSVRDQLNIDDNYEIPDRIWWLLKNDNDIVKGGNLQISDLPTEQLVGIKGQEFSLVFKAQGGEPFTMRSDSPGTGRYWEFGVWTLIEGIARAKASFGPNGTALPSIKKYYNRDDAKKIQAVMNFLPWYDYGHTQDATQHSKALKKAKLTDGDLNMTAKPQKLLSHLIALLAPDEKDIVMSIGENNCVFSSVAMKIHKKFVHIIGASDDDLYTWDHSGSKRIKAVLNGLDTNEIEGNDSIGNNLVNDGCIDVLRLSDSYLVCDLKTGEIIPSFEESESIEAFYAGLSGAYYHIEVSNAFKGMDDRIVIVLPEDESLDNVFIEKYKSKLTSNKLIFIYESNNENLKFSKNVFLKRAPFELI